MASAKLYNLDGNEVGSVELSEGVFNTDVAPSLIHEVAVALQAHKRQGNHETKTRTQVSGGGRKPYRQKGTGNARHGSTREPQMRGGGSVFGPHKRSYRTDTPASFKRKALVGVLTDRARTEALCVLETADYAEPKTKPVVRLLEKLTPNGKSTLIVTAGVNKNLLLSARNIPKVVVRTASDLNALDVLGAAHIVLVHDAVAKLEERLS